MTNISGSQSSPIIQTIDDLRAYYQGTDTNDALNTPKIGAEIEFALCKQKGLSPLSFEDNAKLVKQAKENHIGIRNEPPTTAIEIASPAFEVDELKSLIKTINDQIETLVQLSIENDLVLSPFGQIPDIAMEDLKIVDLPRYQTFFVPRRKDIFHIYRFFTSCMSIQTSISYRNTDHLLKIIRMATALEPILFLSTDGSSRFMEGKEIFHTQNIGQKDKLHRNSGIPDFYYSAENGQELIDHHIKFSLEHRHVFTYFNHDGELTRLPPEQWLSFNDLETLDLGPKNLINYMQLQSQHWRRACNISTVLDEQNALLGHRAEIVSWQTGLLHQRATALALSHLIAFDDTFYEETSVLLQDFGIDLSNLEGSRDTMEGNFKTACYHNNRYHDLQFGYFTIKDFTQKWAEIIEKASKANNLEKELTPILHILKTGRPDWLVYREKFKTLAQTNDYLSNFNQNLAQNPTLISAYQCADTLFS